MVYEFRPGFNYPVPAAVVATELERIWEKQGQQLRPEAVVNEARLSTSPLHPCFEWEDAAAAEKFRLHQARNLTRAVHVVCADGEKKQLFVHVEMENNEQPHYQHIRVILDKPGEYLAGLMGLKRQLDALQRSFESLQRHAFSQDAKPGDIEKLAAIVAALSTAKEVAEHLQ